MAYHVEILRSQNGKRVPITRSDVDSLMTLVPGTRVTQSNLKDAEVELVVPTNDNESFRLTLQHGTLWAKNPVDSEIQAMIDIGNRLGARVRGDEFETFRTANETFVHPDDREELELARSSGADIRQSVRRKQWMLNLTIVTVFTVLAGLVIYFSKRPV